MPTYVPGMPFVNGQASLGPQNHRHIQPQNVILKISQQPKEALVTTDGKEKVRKPIDPPPIVELKIPQDVDPNQHFLQSPYLFMTCSLVKNDDTGTVVKHASGKPALSGSLTSSLHRLKDTTNIDGAYFVFGDVSCKETGTHRLKFCLFDLHKDTKDCHFLASIMSQPFNVVLSKDFRGLDESTYLSRAFSDQGVRLRLRKEPRTQHGGMKRPHSGYGGMSTSPGHHQQEAGFEDDDYASQQSNPKRSRGFSNTHRQPEYSYSNHQPVRTPENAHFPQQPQAFMQAGYSSSFNFSGPPMAPTSFVGTTGSSASNSFDPSLVGGFDYPTNPPRGVLDSPHQPHGLSEYTRGGMHQGSREEEAAGGLQSLAVQGPHTGHMASQSMYLQGNSFGHGFSGNMVDPALMDTARPISRYEENVQSELHTIKKQGDKIEGNVQMPGGDYIDSNGY
ncbi:ATP-dependent DNA helicase [Venturia nashicola]|uniref:ATP-dependent DNA helicase n=1 Tax=Venturia nashicola TaxID=86259 RepID=A0A4Z1NP29_9PEZI|nr:ATP-dependent DNA helicase [Venturia nashicola]TLD20798.1 ATP-dependent DNA helicase [Venturia nashicola]